MGLIAKLYEDDVERSRIMGFVLGGIAMGVLIGYPMGGILFDFVGEAFPFVILVLVTGTVLTLQLR